MAKNVRPQMANGKKCTSPNGIVDFYIAAVKLVIELDGSQHYEDDGMDNDIKRESFLNDLGIKVLRYSNLDVNQRLESVCEDILNHINTSSVTS